MRRLVTAVGDAKQSGTQAALLFLHVDHFKQINGSLGPDAGDALLCGDPKLLREIIRRTDTAARLGGDEFGLILGGIDRPGTDRGCGALA